MISEKIAIFLRESFFAQKPARVRVEGYSMYPFLRPGQLVGVKPVENSLSCGKCYVFLRSNDLVIHRLLFVSGEKAVFFGDNNRYFEVTDKKLVIAELESDGIDIMTTGLKNLFNRIPVLTIYGMKCAKRLFLKKIFDFKPV